MASPSHLGVLHKYPGTVVLGVGVERTVLYTKTEDLKYQNWHPGDPSSHMANTKRV